MPSDCKNHFASAVDKYFKLLNTIKPPYALESFVSFWTEPKLEIFYRIPTEKLVQTSIECSVFVWKCQVILKIKLIYIFSSFSISTIKSSCSESVENVCSRLAVRDFPGS